MHREREEQDAELRVALRRPGRGPLQIEGEAEREQVGAARADRDARLDGGDEAERVELEQDVEAEVPDDAEPRDAEIEVELGAELDGVRGDREVRREPEPGIVLEQAQRDAPQLRDAQVGRRRIGRMEAADGREGVLLLAPAEANGDVAFEGEAEVAASDIEVVDARIEREKAELEVDRAEEGDLDVDDRVVLVGDGGAHQAEHRDPRRVVELDDEAEVDDDERRHAPGDARHRTDDELIALGRENPFELRDHRGHVRCDVTREEDVLRGAVAEIVAQAVEVDRPVQAEHASDALEIEIVAEEDRPRENRVDEEEKREALRAVRQDGVDDADRGELERIEEPDLDGPGRTDGRLRRCRGSLRA